MQDSTNCNYKNLSLPDLSSYSLHTEGEEQCKLCGSKFQLGELHTHNGYCARLEHCWKVMGQGLDEDGTVITAKDNPTPEMIERLSLVTSARRIFLADYGLKTLTGPV